MTDSSSELTVKQENFALKFVETGNASRAYRHAYEADEMLPGSVWREASLLLKHPKVAQRIAELREMARELALVTVCTVTEELEEARRLAIKTEQPSSAVSASMGKAKLHGLIVDKNEHSGPEGKPIETKDTTSLETAKRIAFILAQATQGEK